ncbi:hypothetical protein PLESTF_001705000, partial [Pleodorina starrii]
GAGAKGDAHQPLGLARPVREPSPPKTAPPATVENGGVSLATRATLKRVPAGVSLTGPPARGPLTGSETLRAPSSLTLRLAERSAPPGDAAAATVAVAAAAATTGLSGAAANAPLRRRGGSGGGPPPPPRVPGSCPPPP